MELDIVRAWKDASYRQSLSPEQQAQLPASPVGDFEFSEAELANINGGNQGGSQVGCHFTGNNRAQCPTIDHPGSLCKSLEGPHSVALGSGMLLHDVSELTGELSFLCA
jgi:mersacidin/lichenicidin family type 2 lantibiotic